MLHRKRLLWLRVKVYIYYYIYVIYIIWYIIYIIIGLKYKLDFPCLQFLQKSVHQDQTGSNGQYTRTKYFVKNITLWKMKKSEKSVTLWESVTFLGHALYVPYNTWSKIFIADQKLSNFPKKLSCSKRFSKMWFSLNWRLIYNNPLLLSYYIRHGRVTCIKSAI